LLVEDDEDVRTVLSMLLSKEMFDVTEAENGQVALERVYEEVPEIILCDLMMPIMDGKEFLLRLRANQHTRNIPVIVLTAADTEANEINLLELGASDFVSKAASSNVMLSRIRRVLSS
jgi:DNA-binding response OmpR family regulator